ncbi:glycoside hydrolase [Aspergillus homomorphus CBS 101889]|uniref:endo-polygalacturonase n=1 Tax=Aspergillus homomorphus (strain CBS 101889) TaxID=1450537 RepID=A0A395HIV3_ASPHC|nr:glycoside hydrolase [Aspergillus homomorphus CBS 101889]RAL07851.1 glycoside hydrolase [Aspergillus homomorphus CBS 101889]
MHINPALLVSLALRAIAVGASPAPSAITAPPTAQEIQKRATSCTFSESNDASLASKSKTSCSTIVLSNVAVPLGTTLDLTKLNDGTHVRQPLLLPRVIFEGETTFGYWEWSGPLISVSGSAITVTGASGHSINGGSGGKTKPKFFAAHSMTNSVISGLRIENSPVQNIYFSGGVCSGGHGLSIASVGGRSDNTVKNVTFYDSTIKTSQDGVCIKTIYGDTGAVSDITYKDITLSSITKYGIIVQQNYDDTSKSPSNGVTIKDFVLDKVQGTAKSTAYDIYIACWSGSCTDWTWSDASVTGGKTSSSCVNVPSGVSC